MTKYNCSKCGYGMIADKVTFCPKCGAKFAKSSETVRMVTTDEGDNIITIDRKAFVDTENEEEIKGKYTSEWYSKEMRNPNSPYYIPPHTIMYEDEITGRVITHEEAVIVHEEDIPKIKEVEGTPTDTVIEEDIKAYVTETIDKRGGDREIHRYRLVDTKEKVTPIDTEELKKFEEQINKTEKESEKEETKKEVKSTKRPKFSEIIKMDLSIEKRAALAKEHGYADSTIKRWKQKVTKQNDKTV